MLHIDRLLYFYGFQCHYHVINMFGCRIKTQLGFCYVIYRHACHQSPWHDCCGYPISKWKHVDPHGARNNHLYDNPDGGILEW